MEAKDHSQGKKRTAVLLAGFAACAIIAVTGTAVYRDQFAPYRTTVLVVDDTQTNMDYLVKRVRMSGQPPLTVLQALTLEQIVAQVAPFPPYSINARDEDIDRLLMATASDGASELAEAEFSEWLRQQLNETGLSRQEYHNLFRTRLLIQGLRDHLADQVPTVGPHVRLSLISLPSRADSEQVIAKLADGESFETLARQYNSDPDLKARGGDVGWHSRAGLAPDLERMAFDVLDVGDVSLPVPIDENTWAVFKVTELEAKRDLRNEDREAMRASVFDQWIARELQEHRVEYHGFENGYDSETDQWVRDRAFPEGMPSGGER